MDLRMFKVLRHGRTYLWIEATPKSPQARALLRKFQIGVSQFEKRWRAVAKAAKKRKK
jgi:hypothetical protein